MICGIYEILDFCLVKIENCAYISVYNIDIVDDYSISGA